MKVRSEVIESVDKKQTTVATYVDLDEATMGVLRESLVLELPGLIAKDIAAKLSNSIYSEVVKAIDLNAVAKLATIELAKETVKR